MNAAIPPLFYIDRSTRGRLRLTGRDRQSFLQGMVTNDIASLKPGDGCYAFQIDATAHVLADLRVLCADGYLLLDVEPGLAETVAQTLERYLIMEKCRITDVTETLGQTLIGGAAAADFLATRDISNAATWTEGQNAPIGDGLVARTTLLTVPTFDVYLPTATDEIAELHAALEKAGAVAISPELVESLRIEAGIPRYGQDIDAKILAPETEQAHRAIHRRKGCYIGQEIVARIDARGRTNRAFTGFHISGTQLPTPGALIEAEGREVGRITSATLSPTSGKLIALGYLRNDAAQSEAPLTIDGLEAQTAPLPFTTDINLDSAR